MDEIKVRELITSIKNLNHLASDFARNIDEGDNSGIEYEYSVEQEEYMYIYYNGPVELYSKLTGKEIPKYEISPSSITFCYEILYMNDDCKDSITVALTYYNEKDDAYYDENPVSITLTNELRTILLRIFHNSVHGTEFYANKKFKNINVARKFIYLDKLSQYYLYDTDEYKQIYTFIAPTYFKITPPTLSINPGYAFIELIIYNNGSEPALRDVSVDDIINRGDSDIANLKDYLVSLCPYCTEIKYNPTL